MLLTSLLLPVANRTTVAAESKHELDGTGPRLERSLSETNMIGNLFFRHQQSE